MIAYRMVGPGEARLVDVPEPRQGPGEALLKVLAVGVCHSDLNVRAGRAGSAWPTPYTLGHEICAEIVDPGTGVSDLCPGQQVLVHGPIGCGRCRRCAVGEENVCVGDRTVFGVGLGVDGGMAPMLVTDARRLIPADGLDPVHAAALTDSALTSIHAISMCRSLDHEDAVAVVVGVGGLGHLAVQLLRALTPATVVAIDVRPRALDLAAACGAHHVVDGRSGMTSGVRSSIGGGGVDAVLDFVVDPVQVEESAGLLGPGGDLVLVGAGGGAVEVRKPGRLPPDSRVCTPSWGTRDELRTLVRLARAGKVSTEVTSRALCDVEEVLGELDAGHISGRAVLVP